MPLTRKALKTIQLPQHITHRRDEVCRIVPSTIRVSSVRGRTMYSLTERCRKTSSSRKKTTLRQKYVDELERLEGRATDRLQDNAFISLLEEASDSTTLSHRALYIACILDGFLHMKTKSTQNVKDRLDTFLQTWQRGAFKEQHNVKLAIFLKTSILRLLLA